MGDPASCGHVNDPDAKFCNTCGASLAPPTLGDERKVVTILFCDLVGYTTASDAADPEDVSASLRRYHSEARRIVGSFGGVIEKFIGDAVCAVFGVPTIHEDDPVRAVRAALAMCDQIPASRRSPSPRYGCAAASQPVRSWSDSTWTRRAARRS